MKNGQFKNLIFSYFFSQKDQLTRDEFIHKYFVRPSDHATIGTKVTPKVVEQEPGKSIRSVQRDPNTSGIGKISNKDTIQLYYQNVNSIKGKEKQTEISKTFNERCNEYDVMALTETWLGPEPNIIDGILKKYDVYRCNTKHGVLIAVSSKLYSDPVIIEGFDHLEYVCVKIFHKNHFIYIYCLYIDTKIERNFYEQHFKAIEKIEYSKNDTLIVIGDFNIEGVSWEKGDVGYVTKSKDKRLQLFTRKFKYQLSNLRKDGGNVLDLAFVNNIEGITLEKVEKKFHLSKEDPRHPPFKIVIDSMSSFIGFQKCIKEYAYSEKNRETGDLESKYKNLNNEYAWMYKKEESEEKEAEEAEEAERLKQIDAVTICNWEILSAKNLKIKIKKKNVMGIDSN